MHICIIGPYFPPDFGASSTQVWNLSHGLAEKGARVTVITAFPHYPDGIVPEGYLSKFFVLERLRKVDVIRLWVPPIASRGFIRRALLFLVFSVAYAFFLPFARGVQILLVVGPWAPSPFSIPAIVYGKASRKRVVIYEVDSIPDILFGLKVVTGKFTQRILKFIGKAIEVASDAVVTYTDSIVEMILKRGVDSKKVFKVPLPVDTDVFRPSNVRDESQWLRMGPGKFVVMYSGILGPFYDFDTLLGAASLLRDVTDVEFVIRGEGEMKGHIKNVIKKLELNNVRLLGKTNDYSSVGSILSVADVFVVPMKHYPIWSEIVIPTKIGEYMGCAKPIVACALGETEKFLREKEVGLCVPPRDIDALAKSILMLREDLELRQKLSLNARKVALHELSTRVVTDKLLAIFRQIRNVNKRGPTC